MSDHVVLPEINGNCGCKLAFFFSKFLSFCFVTPISTGTAPEILATKKAYPASDVYSFGMVVWEVRNKKNYNLFLTMTTTTQ